MAKWVRCQLVGEDDPRVPMDPPKFMLAPLLMTIAKNALWRRGITYIDWIREELDYDEFNHTHLMPFLIVEVYALSSHLFLIPTLCPGRSEGR